MSKLEPKKFSFEVTLTPEEIQKANEIGRKRNAENRKAGRWNRTVRNSLEADMMGARCEMAACKCLGVPWHGQFYTDKQWKAYGRYNGDIGNFYEVRGTNYATGRLILHSSDRDKAPFILVIEDENKYSLVGWVLGAEGKLDKFWWQTAKIPAYFVDRSVMHPMETLPKICHGSTEPNIQEKI